MNTTRYTIAKLAPVLVAIILVLAIAVNIAYLKAQKQWSLVIEPGLSEGQKYYRIDYIFPGRRISLKLHRADAEVCIGGRLIEAKNPSTSIECRQLCSGYIVLVTNESKPFSTVMTITSSSINKTVLIAINAILAPPALALILYAKPRKKTGQGRRP